MRRLIQLSEGKVAVPGSPEEVMPHQERLLRFLAAGPKSPEEIQVSPREFFAMAHANYICPMEGEKTLLTSKLCRWKLTPLGAAALDKLSRPVAEEMIEEDVNQDGEDSPLTKTRKRKRASDPTGQKWFKELFSKRS